LVGWSRLACWFVGWGWLVDELERKLELELDFRCLVGWSVGAGWLVGLLVGAGWLTSWRGSWNWKSCATDNGACCCACASVV
jgi:hypothetical protein